jgi:hypothetical protein
VAVILFIFHLLIFILCLGVGLAVIIYVPLTIYSIPYCLWVGFQNNVGKHLDKKKEGFWKGTRNATILYKSWILRREPTF